ncbi:S-layer homology domain-containing protein [Paenibacillus sp. 1P07SE]|uniref:S-layer homology domain-containing protein n=1 Tax=Paenibacillus sp. 1P07SE TaxID=3132209 RepID=UPI0039A63E12
MGSKNKLWILLLVWILTVGHALPLLAAAEAGEQAADSLAADQPITLLPTDDAFVEGQAGRQDNTNGSSGELQLAHDGHANPRTVYLKFDLSAVDLTDIRSAALQLYNIDTRYNRTVTAHKTAGNATNWDELTLTANNAPAAGEIILGSDGTPASAQILQIGTSPETRLEGASYYSLDVYSYLQEAGEDGLLSIVIRSNGFTAFASKEYQNGEFPPLLTLSTEEPEEPEEESHKLLEPDGRSVLYPEDWYPGYGDDEGRFLHDFSYAGYRMGEVPIPDTVPGDIIHVTQAPYHADNTGAEDATAAIQQAIDDVGDAGGGVVYLPPGTYRVKPQGVNNQALKINQNGVVLRGAGPEATFLFNDEPVMRGKDIITVTSEGNQFLGIQGTETLLRQDLHEPTMLIPVQDTAGLAAGDWIAISNRYTAAFIEEHDMTGWWNIYEGNEGVTFYRQVVAVDHDSRTIAIDIPTRYPLNTRDHASVYKLNPPVREVGVEHLSIGNAENLTPGIGEADNTVEGTAGYQVAGTKAVRFVRVVDAWARNVHSYRPPSNSAGYDYHILSSGIVTSNSRNVTIADSDMRKPLYRGAGGNGYLYELVGNDNLIVNSRAEEGRHNYTFSHMRTSGNVIRDSVSVNPTHVIDFHQYLSMSNLLEGMILDGDTIEASVRPYPSSSPTYKHGQTTSQTVIWNTTGVRAHPNLGGIAVDSRQHGHGYVIGTQGQDTEVRVTPVLHAGRNTAPVDFTEGIGQGAELLPQSLYGDQWQQRQAREPVALQSIQLNGNPVAGFQSGRREYAVMLPYGTEAHPDITVATAAPGAAVEVIDASSLPGVALIRVTSQDGAQSAEYRLHLSAASEPAVLEQIAVLPDRTKPGWKSGLKLDEGSTAWLYITGMMSDGTEADLSRAEIHYGSDQEELLTVSGEGQVTAVAAGTANIQVRVVLDGTELSRTLAVTASVPVHTELESLPIVAVTSSGDDGNIVENVIDDDYDTRWSASGEGQWMIADLGEIRRIGSASIAFYNGHTRRSIFELDVSRDGETWIRVVEKVDEGNSSGTTSVFERFVFAAPQEARYVRYVGYGNSANAWNSITELRIHPEPAIDPPGSGDSGGGGGGGYIPAPPVPPSVPPVDGASDQPGRITAAFTGPARLITTERAVIEAPGHMFDGYELAEGSAVTFIVSVLPPDDIAGLQPLARRAIGAREVVSIVATTGGEPLDWSNRDAAVTVSLPYEPTASELAEPLLLEKLTVWQIAEDGTIRPIPNAVYDQDAGSMIFRTTTLGHFAIALQEKSFQDITEHHWAIAAVEVLAARGVINGMSEVSYAPALPIRRADLAMLLMDALGFSATAAGAGFPDVADDAYYTDRVTAAARLGIITGRDDGRFDPAASITRQEMFVMMARAMQAAGRLELGRQTSSTPFTDWSDVAPYAADATAALTAMGLIQGHEGQLRPADTITRAEAAVLLYRMLKR